MLQVTFQGCKSGKDEINEYPYLINKSCLYILLTSHIYNIVYINKL